MRFIAHDICRCMDARCPVRHECMRYLARGFGGPRTPVAASLMNTSGDSCDSCMHVDRGTYIAWNGKECPTDPKTLVRVMFADRDERNATQGKAGQFDWGSDDPVHKIVAFALEKI